MVYPERVELQKDLMQLFQSGSLVDSLTQGSRQGDNPGLNDSIPSG